MNFFNRNLERTQNQAVGVIKFLFSNGGMNKMDFLNFKFFVH